MKKTVLLFLSIALALQMMLSPATTMFYKVAEAEDTSNNPLGSIPPGINIPTDAIPSGLTIPPTGIPSGLTIPSTGIPTDMLPPGVDIPSGTIPAELLPDGINIPTEGILLDQIPSGITIPSDTSIPIDMLLPKDSDVPNGLPEGTTIDKINDMIANEPEKLEKLLTTPTFDQSKVGVVSVDNMGSKKEEALIEPHVKDTNSFEGKITEIVLNVFKEETENIVTKASQIILEEIETSTIDDIAKIIDNKGIKVQDLKLGPDNSDLSDLPSEEVVKTIPSNILPKVRAMVLAKVSQTIDQQITLSVTKTQQNTKTVIEKATPEIMEKIKVAIKNIVPKIGNMITQNVDTKIDIAIENAILKGEIELPDEYKNMDKNDIIKELKPSVSKQVETYLRALVLERIKSSIDIIITKKIEQPILDKMKPSFDKLETGAIESSINNLPSHIEVVISKDTIKNIVKAKIGYVKSQISGMIESNKSVLQKQLYTYIDEEIKSEVKIYLGNLKIEADVKPINVNNSLLVPFRAIAEALNAEVKWIPEKKQVVMTKENKEVVLTLDSNEALVGGQKITLNVPAQVSEGRTMVPVRFISEAFGLKVEWQNDWKLVNISE